MMEESVIAPLMGNDILFYRRYVDDVFAVVVKGKEEQIRTKMSSFDPELVFTLEYPENGLLPFLDTCIYMDPDCNLQFRFFRKKNRINYFN
jgi:hypothetical protein